MSAAVALAIGSLTSCSSDELDDLRPNGPEKVDHDQVRYLSVAISSPSAATSRTVDGNFLPGTGDENYIDNMTFVFYDKAGMPTGQIYPLNFANNTNTDNLGEGKGNAGEFNPEGNQNGSAGNVGKIWTSVVPVELKQGENLPAYVMCFINPVGGNEFTSKSLQEVEELQRQQVRLTDNHFPMSNSTYYGFNPISGENDVRMTATPIITGQLFTSQTDAQNATGQSIIEIYVERYAARVTLNLAPQNNDNTAPIAANTTGVNGYSLRFVPEYWRPNAIDENIFAIKRFGLVEDDVTTPDYDPSYDDLISHFKNLTWWNDPDKFRSYWGCSPSYYDNHYPKVSDDITDRVPTNEHTAAYFYKLHYFNYNQIKTNNSGSGHTLQNSIPYNTTTGFNQTFYARETTTSVSAWRDSENYNPMATIVSAVIVGRYRLTPNNGTEELEANKTFYLFGKTNNKWNLYFDDNQVAANETGIIKAMVNQQNVVLKNTGTTETPVYVPVQETTGFVVEHPSKNVRDVKKITVAGRLVALQLDKNNLPSGLSYYNTIAGKYETITTTNVDQVNSDLLATGYARKYGEGLCYFNIPIEHLGIYSSITDTNTGTYVTGAKDVNKGTYDFTKCPAGSFGIVRNHAYNITVNSISGLATALRDATQPIVPPMDEVSYYIKAQVNVLNWRIVPTQQVKL